MYAIRSYYVRNGYDSAEDFAGNFEDLMKNAVLQSLKLKLLEKPITEWYNNYAEGLSKIDATDPEQVKAFMAEQRELFNSSIGAGIKQMNLITDTLGLDFSTSGRSETASGQVSRSITEDTASELVSYNFV